MDGEPIDQHLEDPLAGLGEGLDAGGVEDFGHEVTS